MKILLLGKDGQVGWELQRALAPLGELVCAGRGEVDLEQFDALRTMVRTVRPDILVNAAAYTAVDRAESEPERAMRVNAGAVEVLAQEMKPHNGCLVHYSTDYVFDGTKSAAYAESDATNPQSAYGRSKLAGEDAIRTSGCRHLIFRTGWVYCAHGGNFAKTMLRLARERTEIKVVSDQIGAPTGADLIADVTALALHRLDADPALAGSASGLYHLSAAAATSWYGYATLLIETALASGASLRVTPRGVVPIPSADYPTPARRPANSRLDSARLCATFGLTMPPWQAGVRRLVQQLNETEPQ
jgi:dTDP-4-dehydrorhamnose reductase